jgi:hypothetical protein
MFLSPFQHELRTNYKNICSLLKSLVKAATLSVAALSEPFVSGQTFPAEAISFAPVFRKEVVGRPVMQANFPKEQTAPASGTQAIMVPKDFLSASLFGSYTAKMKNVRIQVSSQYWKLRVYDADGKEIEKKIETTTNKEFWELPATLSAEGAESGTWSWSGVFEVVRSANFGTTPFDQQSLKMELRYKESGILGEEKLGPSEDISPADVWLVAGGAAVAQVGDVDVVGKENEVVQWEAVDVTMKHEKDQRWVTGSHSTLAQAFARKWREKCQGDGVDRTVVVVVVPTPGARLQEWLTPTELPPAPPPPPAPEPPVAQAPPLSGVGSPFFNQAQRIWTTPWEGESSPKYGVAFRYRGLVFWHGGQDADYAAGAQDDAIGEHDPLDRPALIGETGKNSLRNTYATDLATKLLLPWWKNQVAEVKGVTARPLQVLLAQPPPVSYLSRTVRSRMEQWEKVPGKALSEEEKGNLHPVSTQAAIRFAQCDVARHFDSVEKIFSFNEPSHSSGRVNLLFPVRPASAKEGKLELMTLHEAGGMMAEMAFWRQSHLDTPLCPTLKGDTPNGRQIYAWPQMKVPEGWLHFAKATSNKDNKIYWPPGDGKEPQNTGAVIPEEEVTNNNSIQTPAVDAPEGPWPSMQLEDALAIPFPVFDLPLKRSGG